MKGILRTNEFSEIEITSSSYRSCQDRTSDEVVCANITRIEARAEQLIPTVTDHQNLKPATASAESQSLYQMVSDSWSQQKLQPRGIVNS